MSDSQNSERPRIKIRKTETAEPTFNKVVDEGPAPVITHFAPPPEPGKTGETARQLALPIGVSVGIVVFAIAGFFFVRAQNASLDKAEAAAKAAEARLNDIRRDEALLNDRVRDLERELKRGKEKARYDALVKADAELRPEIEKIRQELSAARNAVAAKIPSATAIDNEAREISAKATELRKELEKLVGQAEKMEADNAATKAWLNQNNLTMHPKF